MGIFLFFGLLFLLYFIDKALMVITAIIMAIYVIVKKIKKQKIGKIIILPIVILIVLEILSLPADLLTVSANIEAIKYNSELKTRDYVLAEETEDEIETLIYHGKKYVRLTDELTTIIGDGMYQNRFNDADSYEELAPLVEEEALKFSFQWFFFNPSEQTVYKVKGSPDDKILFDDYCEQIWCLEEDFETAKQTYSDIANYDYYIIYTVDDVEKQQKIDFSVYEEILTCKQKDDDDDVSYFDAAITDYDKVSIYAKSQDGRVMHEYICRDLVMQNGNLYYYYASNTGRDLNVELK